MFQFFNDGRAAALATVLFMAVLPVMFINLRNFDASRRRDDGAGPATTSQRPGVGRVAAGGRRCSRSLPLRIAVVVICLLWTLPTLGLLVTSFRDPLYITTDRLVDGAAQPVRAANQWTLANYADGARPARAWATPSSTA